MQLPDVGCHKGQPNLSTGSRESDDLIQFLKHNQSPQVFTQPLQHIPCQHGMDETRDTPQLIKLTRKALKPEISISGLDMTGSI